MHRCFFSKGIVIAAGICAAIIVILAGPATARAQVVSGIVVEGNRRVEAETVRAYMQVNPGEEATPGNIDESIKALFKTGLFSDVRIYHDGGRLVVRVEENPLINRVSFEGNSEFDEDDLHNEAQLRERMVFTRARVQSDVQRLTAVYRRAGYFRARIEPKIVRLPQNRVDLVFEIDEGELAHIGNIDFIGNRAFSDGQLRSVILTAETAWWKFFSTTDRYDPDRLAYDRELLRRHYLQHGFADFRVKSANAEMTRDGEEFFITFVLEEGEQYTVGDVKVDAGTLAFDADRLKDIVTTASGDVYDAGEVDKTVENISIETGNSGFAFAEVKPAFNRDKERRLLNITYNIEEGPRVYIERIDIIGNGRTLDEVIRREFRLVEGDAYNRVLLDRARRRLIGLNFFSDIQITEKPGSAPDKVILTVKVQEQSTGTISFSAGYSSQEQALGSITLTERNFLGRAQDVKLATSFSFKRQAADFSFTEPYFLGRDLSAGIDIFGSRADNESSSSYTLRQIGSGLRFGFPLSENERINTHYRFVHREIDIDNGSDVSRAVRDAEGNDDISLFGISYVYSDLDHPFRPTSGKRLKLSTDIAGLGGDVAFVRTELAAHYFHPLFFDGLILKLKGTAGHIDTWDDDDVSIIDRFAKGGDSFRGFEVSGIGPRQQTSAGSPSTDSLGGQSYAIGTVEVIFPLGLPEALGMEGVVFTDFGTLFDAPEKTKDGVKVFDDAELRLSVGAGIVWQSPFGPMRFDLSRALVKTDYDETEMIRFSAGTRF